MGEIASQNLNPVLMANNTYRFTTEEQHKALDENDDYKPFQFSKLDGFKEDLPLAENVVSGGQNLGATAPRETN